MDEIFPADTIKDARRLKATMLQSCYLRNEGHGKFTMIPLSKQGQVSALNGMIADDFNGDGKPGIAINANDYGTDVSIGRYDALNGLVLEGDGKGGFIPMSILQRVVFLSLETGKPWLN